jgi:hypothetical protein
VDAPAEDRRKSPFWEWFDRRDVDKHIVVLLVMVATYRITQWGMDSYRDWIAAAATGHMVSGVEAAALVAAVMAPWAYIVQGVVAWYFKTRISE